MAKKAKKVDVKAVAKGKLIGQITGFLTGEGYEVIDAEEYGYTKGTIIVRDVNGVDVQLKPITPNAKNGNTYKLVADEEESAE